MGMEFSSQAEDGKNGKVESAIEIGYRTTTPIYNCNGKGNKFFCKTGLLRGLSNIPIIICSSTGSFQACRQLG